jgi:hypothetical protein
MAHVVLLGVIIDLHEEVVNLVDLYVMTGYYFFSEQVTP